MRDLKNDFPVFSSYPHVYLDAAATSHKPSVVIDGIADVYRRQYGSVHRGLYSLSGRASNIFETARETIGDFLNARQRSEIVFTSGATESINLVASGLRHKVVPGKNIVVTQMEHHANFVPWQQVAKKTQAELRIIPLNKAGLLDIEAARSLIDEETVLVAVVHLSNVTGTLNEVGKLTEMAGKMGALSLVDAAQSISQVPTDVQALGCDFLVFSGHKVYGPTGIGVLYGRTKAFENLEPTKLGGGMVRKVTNQSTEFRMAPYGFEVGSPNLVGAAGLAIAIEYLSGIGLDNVREHSEKMCDNLVTLLSGEGISIVNQKAVHQGSVSFLVDDIHPHDVATILGTENISVRAGHHCAQPLMNHLGVRATVRASFGIYNNEQDLRTLLSGLIKVRKIFS